MQLKSLYIKDYKILKDFTIDFAYDFERYISVFIGDNGSGKSTVLEAIAQIFSCTILSEKSKFDFKLEYSIKSDDIIAKFSLSDFHHKNILIKITGGTGYLPKVAIDFDLLQTSPSTQFKLNLAQRDFNNLMPDGIIIYYSGLSEIVQKIVEPHNELISISYRKNNTLTERDFFYFKPEHFGIFLTSLLSFKYGDIPEFLKLKAKIGGVQSIQIRLKKPDWANDKIENFWGAKGEVRNFLDYLKENATSIEGLQNPDKSNGVENIVIEAWQDELLIITIISQNKLFEIRDHLIDERNLFEILNIMLIDGLLKDIQFSLQQVDNNKPNFGILSEGEQQSIIIKGLTELLAEKNTLFLFDEPDTYLHPKWQRQFISEIEKTINIGGTTGNNYVIATHSPNIVSGIFKNDLFVLREGKQIEVPFKSYGNNIETILIDFFGLEGVRNKYVENLIKEVQQMVNQKLFDTDDFNDKFKELKGIIRPTAPEIVNINIEIAKAKKK